MVLYQFNIHAVPLFITSIFVALLGTFTILKNSNSLSYRYFFAICICVFIWLVATAMGYISINPNQAAFWFKIDNFGVMFVSPLFLGLAAYETGYKLKKTVFIGILISAIFGFLGIFNSYFLIGVKKFYWGYFPQWKLINSLFFFAFWFAYATISFLILSKTISTTTSDLKKIQLKFLRAGFLIIYLASFDYLATFGINLYPFGFIPTFIFLLIIAYAIIKYDLLDFSFAAKKLLCWIISIFIIFTLIYFPYGFMTSNLSSSVALRIGLEIIFISVGLRLLLNFFNPILLKEFETRLQHLKKVSIKNIIFNNKVDFSINLTKNIAKIMNSKLVMFYILNDETGNFYLSSKVTNIKPEILEKIEKNILKNEKIIIEYFTNTKKSIIKQSFKKQIKNNVKYIPIFALIEKYNLEAIFPFSIDNRIVAFFVLGGHKTSSLYHKKELEELSLLIQSKRQNFAITYSLATQEQLGVIAQKMIDIDDFGEFNRHIIFSLKRIFNSLNGSLYIKNEETGDFEARCIEGYENHKKIPRKISASHHLIKLILETEDILTAKNYKHKTSNYFNLKENQETLNLIHELKAGIIIPLVSVKVIGLIFLGDKRINEDYERNDFMIIKNISRLAAVKIHSFMIKEASEIDALTKTYNKSSFNSWMHRFILTSKKEKKMFALLALDLDFFKQYNDTKGHDYGDLVLKEFAKKVQDLSRTNDIIIRNGGDEFLWLLHDIPPESLDSLRNRLLKSLKSGKYTKNLTLSIGNVSFMPDRIGEEIKTSNIKNIYKRIMKLADDASYRSKKEGRNKMFSGGIVKDTEIGDKDTLIIQIVADTGKYFDNFSPYFTENDIDVKRSNWEETISIFEKTRPDRFLFIIDENINIEKAVEKIKKVKTRTLSTKITVLLDKGISQEQFKDLSIDRFYSIYEPKMISDWAKLIKRDED
jgi:diguanylate cyclase (GGDEF)-like protein